MFEKAREILGDEFLSPNDVSLSEFSNRYSPAQLTEFEQTLPDEKCLKQLKQEGFFLTAGPAQEVSILFLDKMFQKKLLYRTKERLGPIDYLILSPSEYKKLVDDVVSGRKRKCLCEHKRARFAVEEKVTARWYAMQKKAFFPQASWIDLVAAQFPGFKIPTAIELVWSMAVFWRIYGKKLFSEPTTSRRVYIRTSSPGIPHMESNGFRIVEKNSHVIVGWVKDDEKEGEGEISISDTQDDEQTKCLGSILKQDF